MPKITKTFVDKTDFQDNEKTYWDDDIKCFGLRVRKESKSYIIMYRNAEGRTRKLTLGKTNHLTPTQARQLAQEKLAEVIQGKDPATEKTSKRKQMTVAELCDWYLKEGCDQKKESTIYMDKSRIERHIKPLIGKLSINSITPATVEKMMIDIARGKTSIDKTKGDKARAYIKVTGGKGVASRTIGMFGSILEFAKRHRLIENNPARGVKKYSDKKKNISLYLDEVEALGKALKEAEKQGVNRNAIDAIKLLLLTGCRKMEVLSLKWDYVDLKNKCFYFPDTKSGEQIRAFGQGALNLLIELKEYQKNEWVFPSNDDNKHFLGLPRVFEKICSLKDNETNQPFLKKSITLHTLRHSFASIGADMGFTEITLAGLLGHSLKGVTNRYIHNVDSSLINTADKISLRIENALNGRLDKENNVVELKRG